MPARGPKVTPHLETPGFNSLASLVFIICFIFFFFLLQRHKHTEKHTQPAAADPDSRFQICFSEQEFWDPGTGPPDQASGLLNTGDFMM